MRRTALVAVVLVAPMSVWGVAAADGDASPPEPPTALALVQALLAPPDTTAPPTTTTQPPCSTSEPSSPETSAPGCPTATTTTEPPATTEPSSTAPTSTSPADTTVPPDTTPPADTTAPATTTTVPASTATAVPPSTTTTTIPATSEPAPEPEPTAPPTTEPAPSTTGPDPAATDAVGPDAALDEIDPDPPAPPVEAPSGRIVVPDGLVDTGAVRSITFPVAGPVSYSNDFGACRDGCSRAHQGNDLIGDRLQPLLAMRDGVIDHLVDHPTAGYGVVIRDEEGWEYRVYHVNNDSPTTDDGTDDGTWRYAPGIEAGATVAAGQLIGFMGDSGNSEHSVPHVHVEIHRPDGSAINPYWSLRRAQHDLNCTVFDDEQDGPDNTAPEITEPDGTAPDNTDAVDTAPENTEPVDTAGPDDTLADEAATGDEQPGGDEPLADDTAGPADAEAAADADEAAAEETVEDLPTETTVPVDEWQAYYDAETFADLELGEFGAWFDEWFAHGWAEAPLPDGWIPLPLTGGNPGSDQVAARMWVSPNGHTPVDAAALVVGDPRFTCDDPLPDPAPLPADVVVILDTIRSMESGDDYSAESSSSTASGAYQFLDSSWAGYGGYARAMDAPPHVQDAKAVELVSHILTNNGGDVSTVPVSWYIGHVPVGAEWDTVPTPAGNTLTPREYQQRWLNRYNELLGQPADPLPRTLAWTPVDTTLTCHTIVVDVGTPDDPRLVLTQAQRFVVDPIGRALPAFDDPCDPARQPPPAPPSDETAAVPEAVLPERRPTVVKAREPR